MKSLWLISASLIVRPAYSQSQPSTAGIVVSDASVYVGFSNSSANDNSLENLRLLAPESNILARDLSDFTSRDGSTINTSTVFTALIGLAFRSADGMGRRANPKLRLGFTLVDQGSIGLSLNQITRTPFDTLISSQTGNQTYVDSVFTESIFADYTGTQIQLDVSMIWSTNTQSRWTLFGGIGLRAGFGINSYTTVSLYEDAYQSDAAYFYRDDNQFGARSFERVSNENGFSTAVYLPFGIDFRLGNNRFWKQTSFVTEFRPAIGAQRIPELETIVAASFAMNFGVCVAW